MGYVSKDIALITEPKRVTLSALPNFVVFESKPAEKRYLELNLHVRITPPIEESATLLRVTAPAGEVYEFQGTTDPEKAGGAAFFISSDPSDTAENLRQALLLNPWIKANFEIVIPFTWAGGNPVNGKIINIRSKGAGKDFNALIAAPNNTNGVAYTLVWTNRTSRSNDSISGEESTAEIDLDVYTDPGVFLGEDDRPTNAGRLGTYLTTLQKTYTGPRVWFELNALFSQSADYRLPPGFPGWFEPGTCKAYRFVAKVKGVNSFYFYLSNALYVLQGHGPASEESDMEEYVYNGNVIKLLTNKPRTPFVRGQKEYLNFIFSDPQRSVSHPGEFTLRIAYRAYSTSDAYIGTVYGHVRRRSAFGVVNTCVLDIDAVLDRYPTTGIVRVALARDTAIVSNDIEYTVRPDCLHTLRQFSFINRLGGWDAFNFDADLKTEIKPAAETYNKTITPDYKKGDSQETVYDNSLTDTRTIEGAPVTDEVADWLRELAAARVVLDGAGNYVIIEDFTLAKTADNFNMQKPTIKYRLSDV